MLGVSDLTKTYRRGLFKGKIRAVHRASFHIARGESFGLMGASGSGKSTIARLILRLEKADSGRVVFNGTDVLGLSKRDLFPFRKKIQMIFQQPAQALDPRQTVFSTLAEPLLVHGLAGSKKVARQRVARLLDDVGLSDELLNRYPSQISGGQAQRVVIARALGLNPECLIADEPTSMLDISIQAQILALLKKLQQKMGIAVLLISHDRAIVHKFCDRMAVLQSGEIVSRSSSESILE